MAFEVNFDGIVGTTHNYSGLSYGNVASVKNQQQLSNPRHAALQGLAKMKFLADLGLKQGVLPPQERPHIPTLRRLGFEGSNAVIIREAYQQNRELLFACSSASAMWAANAATVAPSADSGDGLVHFTVANLSSKFHRSIEPLATSAALQAIFSDPNHFIHHAMLPPGSYITDEGAANHTRFCRNFGEAGVQLFVYGKHAFQGMGTSRFPARQAFEASQSIARLHRLDPERVIFAQQNPKAIDAGVFHNDVISVGNQNVFFYHTAAFVDTDAVIEEIKKKVKNACEAEMIVLPVPEGRISLEEAVATYLFNSQILSMPNGKMQLIAPSECLENAKTKSLIEEIIADSHNPIDCVAYMNLHESMRNGGGPACLRLRVVLTEDELAKVNPHVILDDELYDTLVEWVKKHYRDRLTPDDLADPQLLVEGHDALDELTQILQLGSIYEFQGS